MAGAYFGIHFGTNEDFEDLLFANLQAPASHRVGYRLQSLRAGWTYPACTRSSLMNNFSRPPRRGLYDPRFEHDACGIGFVARLSGAASHDILAMALTAVG